MLDGLKCSRSLTDDRRLYTPPFDHSGSLFDDNHSPSLRDHNHMRVVLDTVGIPPSLDQFPSTKVLIEAIREAVDGHRFAFRTGVWQRDSIGTGNVLVLPPLENAPIKGFVCDLYCSSFVDTNKDAVDNLNDLKERTDTYHYLACELLDSFKAVVHCIQHDLESFYWLVLWIVLRHTDHAHPKGAAACDRIFSGEDEAASKNSKIAWLATGTLTIRSNKPLTDLVTALTALAEASVKRNMGRIQSAESLSHEVFIRVLDDALEAEGWPEGDKARTFVVPHVNANGDVDRTRTGSKRHQQKQKNAVCPADTCQDLTHREGNARLM
ncbi:uncharacterized protein B0H18DRAFT_1122244 [Fomitopsis serialis]|uniref:uncharacterized protein n=1 Tax=Fomitopsis serialis TaxID=139415 RepID=UPI002008C299|nr:uncharacterized protein B0H18DRAFT_1122244 [Neoantrodia serialis]KAH9919803.1 hypothetical protein B0H18DRAFT_1122244 [Neoantrodia serialis]